MWYSPGLMSGTLAFRTIHDWFWKQSEKHDLKYGMMHVYSNDTCVNIASVNLLTKESWHIDIFMTSVRQFSPRGSLKYSIFLSVNQKSYTSWNDILRKRINRSVQYRFRKYFLNLHDPNATLWLCSALL